MSLQPRESTAGRPLWLAMLPLELAAPQEAHCKESNETEVTPASSEGLLRQCLWSSGPFPGQQGLKGLSQPPFSSGYEHHLLRAPPGEVSGLWEMGWAGDAKQPLLIGAGRQVCWHLFSPVSPPPPTPAR